MADVEERVTLALDEAEKLMAEGDMVHTFRNPAPGMMIGTDWPREKLLKAMKEHGVELAGEMATNAKHGLCLHDGRWLFIATR